MAEAPTRGFHRHKLLETVNYRVIEEIAEAENIKPSCVSGVLRKLLRALYFVEALLAGRQPVGLTMAWAMQPFPVHWQRQVFS